MSDVKWIKLSTDLFNNRKIKQIEKMPEGDAILVVWLKLLVLAGEINDDGLIYITPEIAYTDQLLANQFDKPLGIIQLALKTFQAFGMLDITDNIMRLHNWSKYQNVDGLDKVREKNRLRQQRYRDNKRLESAPVNGETLHLEDCNATNNVTETLSNGTEIEEEKEEEEKKEKQAKENSDDDDMAFLDTFCQPLPKTPKRQSAKGELDAVLDSFNPSDSLREVLIEFIKMRKTMKKPMTPRALKMALKRLSELAKNDNDKIAIVEQSIYHNWDAFYELKNKKGDWGNKVTPINRNSDWEGVGSL